MTGRVAFCAPGRKFDAALILCFRGEEVAEIREHRYLDGGKVIVVSEPELPLWTDADAWNFTFEMPAWPLVECPGCGMPDLRGKFHPSLHSSYCWVTRPSFPPPPPGGLLSGL